jgi:hypothetical protein
MSASSWTLNAELQNLAGQDDLSDWLRSIRLIGQQDALLRLETTRDWHRSGAETYSLLFAAVTAAGQRHEFFMKACVSYGAGVALKEIFAEWLSRRSLVRELGVGTPRLYATGPALLVEEYITYELSEAVARPGQHQKLLRSIGATAGLLIRAGFSPISAHDWRSRGDDVVLVDFGQDLGPAGLSLGSESGLLSEIIDNLLGAGVELSSSDLQLVGSAYEEFMEDS